VDGLNPFALLPSPYNATTTTISGVTHGPNVSPTHLPPRQFSIRVNKCILVHFGSVANYALPFVLQISTQGLVVSKQNDLKIQHSV
jgi:hypothetical protein